MSRGSAPRKAVHCKLLYIEEGRITQRMDLLSSRYSLGRDPANDLSFASARVSRFHARLERQADGGYEVIDLDSANHVRVNGERVGRRVLRSGDVVELSQEVQFLFLDVREELGAPANQADNIAKVWQLITSLPLRELVPERLEQAGTVDESINEGPQLRLTLGKVLDAVLATLQADRGFIALVENGQIELGEAVARNLAPTDRFARSVVQRALETGEVQAVERADAANGTMSMMDLDLQRVWCAPLLSRGVVLGVLYVDTGARAAEVSQDEVRLFRVLASHAAGAVENSRLYLDLLEARRALLGRYEESSRRLVESEEMFRILTEGALQGIFVVQDGQLVYANRAFMELLGEYALDLARLVERVEPEERAVVRRGFGLLASDEELGLEFAVGSGAGRRNFQLHSQPLVFQGAAARQGALVDVTEQRRVAEQHHRHRQLEALGTLASGVAHDFNNVLMVLQASVDLLDEDNEGSDLLTDMRNACRRGAELTQRLLVFARRHRTPRRVVSIGSVVTEVVGLLGRTLPKRIRCTHDGPDEGPYVHGDGGELSNALLNLGLNARDAMPEGGELRFLVDTLEVEDVSRLPGFYKGEYARVRVIDTGIGMSEEVQRRVFEPFFTTKGPDRGTGLGLATAFAVIRQHGGTIDVTSRPGHGSTFTVYIPLTTERPLLAYPTPSSGAKLVRRRVLLVDDEAVIRTLVGSLLSRSGFEVSTAQSGAEALACVEAHQPDLVLLDGSMPDLSGFDVYRKLHQSHPELPVLMLSGAPEHAAPGDPPPGGWPRIMLKPIDAATLVRAIEERLAGAS